MNTVIKKAKKTAKMRVIISPKLRADVERIQASWSYMRTLTQLARGTF